MFKPFKKGNLSNPTLKRGARGDFSGRNVARDYATNFRCTKLDPASRINVLLDVRPRFALVYAAAGFVRSSHIFDSATVSTGFSRAFQLPEGGSLPCSMPSGLKKIVSPRSGKRVLTQRLKRLSQERWRNPGGFGPGFVEIRIFGIH